MDPQQITAVDFFLRQGAVYGLALVFLASILALFLWVAWSTVNILKTWLPQWFQSQIRAHKQVGIGINRLSRFILMMYRKNAASHDATAHIVAAMDVFFSENREKYNVPAQAIFHIQSAKKALQRQDEVDYFEEVDSDSDIFDEDNKDTDLSSKESSDG